MSGRRAAVAVSAALLVALSTDPLQTLVANGDTRTLAFQHVHTKETLTVTFKRRGRYDEAALKQLNWFLRDWRTDEATSLDPHLFDVLWEVHREVGGPGPVTVISAYRSPQTNSMLRQRGRGVARNSLHTVGKAIDFYIPGADLNQLRAMGLRLQRGGVGFYPSSGSPFIHVDTGGVRHWPRMTRDQLAKVFPDGKTVHIPADGRPMPGYALALAEIEGRGGRPGTVAVAAREPAADSAPGDRGALRRMIASVFSRAEDDDHEAEAGVRSNRTRLPTSTELTSAPATGARPAANPMTVASIAPVPPPRPGSQEAAALREGAARPSLGYAAEPSRPLPRFSAVPPVHARLAATAEAIEPPRGTPGSPAAADAARPSARLLAATLIEQEPELHAPEFVIVRNLVEPARAALDVQFGRTSIGAPEHARFSGPAVVALQTVAFDRGAGIVTGATRPN